MGSVQCHLNSYRNAPAVPQTQHKYVVFLKYIVAITALTNVSCTVDVC